MWRCYCWIMEPTAKHATTKVARHRCTTLPPGGGRRWWDCCCPAEPTPKPAPSPARVRLRPLRRTASPKRCDCCRRDSRSKVEAASLPQRRRGAERSAEKGGFDRRDCRDTGFVLRRQGHTSSPSNLSAVNGLKAPVQS